jgi:hypothetical protein
MLWRTGREQRWLLMPTGAQYLAVILQMNPWESTGVPEWIYMCILRWNCTLQK